jgi:hypothetical protein
MSDVGLGDGDIGSQRDRCWGNERWEASMVCERRSDN